MIGSYLKIALGGGIMIVLAVTLVIWLLAQRSVTRPVLGVKEGKLTPCPTTPNCVSSQIDPNDKVHYLPPIAITGEPDKAWKRVLTLLRSQANVTILENQGNYLRTEFHSPIFGFVDDVEFLLDPESKVIHFRSASRVGHSDLNANRKRMKSIRTTVNETFSDTNPGGP